MGVCSPDLSTAVSRSLESRRHRTCTAFDAQRVTFAKPKSMYADFKLSPRLSLDTARPRFGTFSHINYPLRVHQPDRDVHKATGTVHHMPMGVLRDGSISLSSFRVNHLGVTVGSPAGFSVERSTLDSTKRLPAAHATIRARPVISVTRPTEACLFSTSMLYDQVPSRSRNAIERPDTARTRARRGAERLHPPSTPSRPFRLPPMGVSPRNETWRVPLEVPPTMVF